MRLRNVTRRTRRRTTKLGPWNVKEDFRLNIGDNREFPSLSGAPQAQQNTSAQQMWSNPTLRTTQQHSTIQRPQGQGTQQGQPPQAANQQLNQTHDEGVGAAQGQFSAGGDDYRFGGQSGVGQLSGSSQPQTGNIDEFPPLGGSADIGPDRRTGMIQNAAAYGGSTNTNAFPGLGQTRNGLSSPTDAQQDRAINPALGGRGSIAAQGTSCDGYPRGQLTEQLVSRSPFENIRGSGGTPGLSEVSQLCGPFEITTDGTNRTAHAQDRL